MQPVFSAILGPASELTGLLKAQPELAAERMTADELLPDIHWLYVGDTPLHVAAVAPRPDAVRALITVGADVRATNRRRATPLHYACDPRPDSDR